MIDLDALEKRNKRKSVIMMAVGVILIALGIHFFLAPNRLSLGGAAGMAIVISNFVPISTGPILIIINTVLFIVGFIMLGKAFGLKTIICSLGLSLLVWILDIVFPMEKPLFEGKMIQLIAAVMIYGSGVGIVLNNYASTGGSDIFAKILNKYLGIELGKGCLMVDFLITLSAWYAYGTEIAIYSLVGTVLNGLIIDFTINGMNTSKLCTITTSKPDEVSKFLVDNLTRSANIYTAKGAYSGMEKEIVQTVVSNRDFIMLKKYIQEIDPLAFVIVCNASETYGWRWRNIIE